MTDITNPNTERLARLAAHRLRRALAADVGPVALPPTEELVALVAEFDAVNHLLDMADGMEP
ncbi:hypothetical protein ACIF6L_34035 [Kitasatospora sp. NPDC086009]|uniref:hypothetical protein n=1 Tax=unclassified Kitasatospora TaxID=2633591 RepID=UPI0037C8F557